MTLRTAFLLVALAAVAGGCRVVHELQNVQPVSLDSGIISGTVLDDRDGSPITNATLVLLTAAGDTLTDQQQHQSRTYAPDGAYRFVSAHPGTHRLRALVPGFAPNTSDGFAVTINATTEISFRVRLAAPAN